MFVRSGLLEDLVFEVERWLICCDLDWGVRWSDEFRNVCFVLDRDLVTVFDEGGRLFCGVLDWDGDVVGSAVFGGVDCAWSAALWVGSVLYHE